MIKIGITGGIGSGKSVVCSLLSVYGLPVYTADAESKRLSDESPVIKKKLIDLFGKEIYIDGKLDRRKLASFVFPNEKLLKKVNKIIHPVVNKDFKKWVKEQDGKYCILESAILFESGFNDDVDVVVMVYAPVELRLTRVLERDGSSEADVMNRMNRQMPEILKRKRSDFVIINDEVQSLIPQIEELIKRDFKKNKLNK
jgi:dephospho-CoA kinase